MRIGNRVKGVSLAVIAAAVLAAPASAHRMWMMPSTFTLSGEEQYITVDGAISNNLFFPNHVALSLADVSITRPDGTKAEPENGSTLKFRSVFDVKLDQQGTYRISETGAMYFATWQENGETQRRRGSWERLMADGLDQKDGVEFMQSRRRVETFVTLGAPSEGAFAPTGEGLELQPVTHPNDVYVGEGVQFKLLLNGEPAKGVEVEIVRGQDRYRNSENMLTVTADADGVFSFTPEAAGQYWLSAGGRSETHAHGRDMAQSISYVATFEALPS